jgi:hypothetical protein
MAEPVATRIRSTPWFVASALMAISTVYIAIVSRAPFRELLESLNQPDSREAHLLELAPGLSWAIAVPAVAVFLWIASRRRITTTEWRRMRWSVIGVFLFGAAIWAFYYLALSTLVD